MARTVWVYGLGCAQAEDVDDSGEESAGAVHGGKKSLAAQKKREKRKEKHKARQLEKKQAVTQGPPSAAPVSAAAAAPTDTLDVRRAALHCVLRAVTEARARTPRPTHCAPRWTLSTWRHRRT
jgi:hypothetical protein